MYSSVFYMRALINVYNALIGGSPLISFFIVRTYVFSLPYLLLSMCLLCLIYCIRISETLGDSDIRITCLSF